MQPRAAGNTRASGLLDERFLLLETLGRGGMGNVFRAYDRSEQRLVAVKVSTESAPAGPAHPLAAEFETWSRLDHPNIVRAYELGITASGPLPAGTPYLVLEHVAGSPAHRAFRPGGVDSARAETIARQILEALVHVHGRGYLHRDLKPANVLVRPRRGGLKLTDFGLAARVGSSRQAGTVSGSLPYVAPEALLGLPLDARADLYGLGILLFQLVTGRLPARGGAKDMLEWHLCGPPADPLCIRPQLSPRLARFIVRLTTRDRARRPPSAEDALCMLGAASSPGPKARTPHGAPGRAERARVRLALDAARLGAIRVVRLSRPADKARALLEEAIVWAQVRGMRVHRVTGRNDRARLSLAQLVVRLLAEGGPDALACARRHGLERALPLQFVGGLAVIDASGDPERRCGGDAAAGAAAAGFFSEHGGARPTVLVLEGASRAEPLATALAGRLALAAGRAPAAGSGRAGVLVVLPPSRKAVRSRDAWRASPC